MTRAMHRPRKKFPLAALAFVAVLAGTAVHAADSSAEALRLRVEQLRAGQDVRIDGARIAARTLIPEFYERRAFRPAWDRPGRAEAMLAIVDASRDHGLDPADYHSETLRRIASAPPADERAAADRELVLTDALVRLAYHLQFGKVNPRELYPDWNFTRALGAIDPARAMEAAVAAPDLRAAIEAYAPQLPQYRALQAGLAQHRAIEVRGGWPAVAPGPTLKPGVSDARVAALRQRLAASGDLPTDAAAEPNDFDPVLEDAVKRFQSRHGLAVDGAAGRKTLEALNVDVARRIEQIRVNLERARWVAQDLKGDFLVVDIAGFDAALYLGGEMVWRSRAVVGRPYRRTPVFRATVKYLVLNPTWTVPPTILRADVLPQVAKNPAYLARNSMQVVDDRGRPVDAARIDWSLYPARPFPYHIVQDPGDDNSLGRIKFMFPNAHTVYLHDTPAKALFDRTERTFSSGCIRIEQPIELAALLLADAERWSAERVREAIETGETRTVPVQREVPVLLLYFTAAPNGAGGIGFRPDVYDRDGPVLAALGRPFAFRPVDGLPTSRRGQTAAGPR
jgi:murein L,D-transpeptidase YcbB/YkuD